MKKFKINRATIFFIIIVILVLGAIITFMSTNSPEPNNPNISGGRYDQFAVCLKDKGAVFFGAFWCTHCNTTKALFGSSKELLPYVECSTSNGKEQTQFCKDKNIEGYPTWEFADGSRLLGEVSLETLAQKTSCLLPE